MATTKSGWGPAREGIAWPSRFRIGCMLAKIVPLMRILLQIYKQERQPQERFGDYCHRVGIPYLQAQVQQLQQVQS